MAAVDINMGCPKAFSVNKKMGAYLLEDPPRAFSIISNLREKFPDLVLSAKVRVLGKENGDEPPNEERIEEVRYASAPHQTIIFILGLVSAGADAITVHARFTSQRPNRRAFWAVFGKIRERLPNGRLLSLIGHLIGYLII